MKSFRLIPVVMGIALLGFSTLAAQSACPVGVEQALQSIGDACSTMDRNTACYGNRRVSATFAEDQPAGFFTQTGDRAGLLTLHTLSTAPADPATGDWGVALMKVQADIPDTIPGQAVIFVLMGDTEVENAVKPEAAQPAREPVTVHTAAPAPLYAAPDAGSEVLGVADAHSELQADALSPDGIWARVAYQDRPAWVYSISLLEESAVGQLPALDPHAFTPMQAFYFRTGIGQSACAQAPDLLLVQGPEQFAVDIQANGADIRIGSTAILKGSEVIAVTGNVVIFPGTPDAISVPAGYGTSLCLSDPQDLGTDGQANDRQVIEGCVESPPAPLTADQWAQIAVVGQIPAAVINYPVPVEAPPAAACAPNPNWTSTYTIRPGDTLSSLARIFQVSTATLMAGNCLTDTLIYAGQSLRVPFEYVPPPTTAPQVPSETPVSTASAAVCGNQLVEDGEECDDGGASALCTASCTWVPAVCGDGIVQHGEQCDDGRANFNVCSRTCTWVPAVCGDGIVQYGEQCDDAGKNPLVCSRTCTWQPAVCGDGIVQYGETCDDGNLANGDGCSAVCQKE